MTIIVSRTRRPRIRNTLKIAAYGLIVSMAALVSAHAEDQRHAGHVDSGQKNRYSHNRHGAGDRDWNDHAGRAHSYWHRPNFRPEPGVVYAPPVVYYPPQYEEPGFNLVVPLNIR